MEMWSSAMPSRVILLCVLAIVGQSALAVDEQPQETAQSPRVKDMLNAMGAHGPAEKRAYTYVSEYKRLPVYNFGIGKRWVDSLNAEDKRGTALRQYSFGLGKRTRQYSFGLGKRADDGQEYNPLDSNLEYLDVDAFDLPPHADCLASLYEEKRGRPYSFGLGKRADNYGEPIGTGKRPNDLMSQRYHFGLGKRMVDADEDSTQ